MQGGSFAFHRQPVSDASVTVRVNLNQWVRFDRPGTYHVSVTSRRATAKNPPALPPVRSNQIAVTIVAADPLWQKEQLSRILRVLDAIPNSPFSGQPDELRELCNLGTREAAIEMARRMDGGGSSSAFRLYEFGLIRSPFRLDGIREMERLLADPDFPVTEAFLAGLANASVEPTNDRAQMAIRHQEKRGEVKQRLADALPFKRGTAQNVSMNALERFR